MLVNRGALTARDLLSSNAPPSETNCEFCAAAGAVNLTPGAPRQTSTDAANYAGLADRKPGGNYDAQAQRIVKFVVARTGRAWGSSGGTRFAKRPYADVAKFMAAMRDKTVFALWVNAPLKHDLFTQKYPTPTDKAHWLNAVKTGDQFSFFDFQTNREYTGASVMGIPPDDLQPVGGHDPSSSRHAFIGIETQLKGFINPYGADAARHNNRRALHSSDWQVQRGIFETTMGEWLAVAFFAGRQ